MIIDVRLLIALNLVIQLILVLVLLVAFRFALHKDFKKHCTLMRIAVPVQILAVLGVMLPSMNRYLSVSPAGSAFGSEILIHHALGLGVVILWIYINLIIMRVLKPKVKIRNVMRLALSFWAASLLLGLHLYWAFYLS